MTDIIDRLKAYAECNNAMGAYTEANCAYDAIAEIERLRSTLRYIANDYVELSYDKAHQQRNEHMMMARKALDESYKNDPIIKNETPFDDDF